MNFYDSRMSVENVLKKIQQHKWSVSEVAISSLIRKKGGTSNSKSFFWSHIQTYQRLITVKLKKKTIWLGCIIYEKDS